MSQEDAIVTGQPWRGAGDRGSTSRAAAPCRRQLLSLEDDAREAVKLVEAEGAPRCW